MILDARALRIVEDAIDIDDEAEREGFVARACGNDRQLAARVRDLLARDAHGMRLLPTESFTRPSTLIDAVPERIGPYRVREEIARGGMGAVVKAERDDGVFEATVAIKLIRGDLASEAARRRFEEERRILARLRHPGIVRILDGGEVDQRPWLAMDYVEGRPITGALRDATMDARLDAFQRVCEAVAFAHRNLVIHADIKPSNVLMDGDGKVHLLDFGIARLIADLDTHELGEPYPLTKGYAAPERAAGIAPTIASDVFSLGVLLLGILDKQLPRDGVPCVAQTRLPVGQLDGDLAAIAAKALSIASGDRYADVPALLLDLDCCRSHRPVAARTDGGRAYVARRFVRRHWRPLALTALAGLALASATAASTAQYFRAERARGEADRRFDELRGLARFMLFDQYDRLADAPGTVAARAQLADRAAHYLDQLRSVPTAAADLRLETARGYRRLAAILGLPGVSSLGRPGEAATALAKADALLTSVLADHPGDIDAVEERGWIEANRWTLAADTRKSTDTQARARAFFNDVLARDPTRSSARLGLLTLENGRGYDLIWTENRPRDAVPVLRAALARLRATQFPPTLMRQAKLLEVHMLGRLGDAIYYAGDQPGALAPYREQRALAAAQLAAGPSVVWTDKLAEAAFNIAGSLPATERGEREALEQLERAALTLRQVLVFGSDAMVEKRLVIVEAQQAQALASRGRVREAVQVSSASIALREARLSRVPSDPQRTRDLAVALPNHAELLAKSGDRRAACKAATRGVAVWLAIRAQGNLSKRDAANDVPAALEVKARLCTPASHGRSA